jgi:hypothetical protein
MAVSWSCTDLECPLIVYTDLDTSWLWVEWHEV